MPRASWRRGACLPRTFTRSGHVHCVTATGACRVWMERRRRAPRGMLLTNVVSAAEALCGHRICAARQPRFTKLASYRTQAHTSA